MVNTQKTYFFENPIQLVQIKDFYTWTSLEKNPGKHDFFEKISSRDLNPYTDFMFIHLFKKVKKHEISLERCCEMSGILSNG